MGKAPGILGEQVHTFANKREHSICQSKDPAQFCSIFKSETKSSLSQLVATFVVPDAQHATFVVGSLPLGLATGLSDIDLIILIDSREALSEQARTAKSSRSFVRFTNDASPLSGCHLICLLNGIEVEINFVLRPGIRRILQRLRSPGPELTDEEVLILGRLRTGWLVDCSPDHAREGPSPVSDTSLDVYCATREYVLAEKYLEKARKSAAEQDALLSMHLARIAVEKSYQAFFASRGFPSVGVKWLQFLHQYAFAPVSGSGLRMLKESVSLLFPNGQTSGPALDGYLDSVQGFIARTRDVIEEDQLHKIAFSACPQIYRLAQVAAA